MQAAACCGSPSRPRRTERLHSVHVYRIRSKCTDVPAAERGAAVPARAWHSAQRRQRPPKGAPDQPLPVEAAGRERKLHPEVACELLEGPGETGRRMLASSEGGAVDTKAGSDRWVLQAPRSIPRSLAVFIHT
eukprot:scaffold781_cov394-Prasinococcus_capsulatus_cf.AAC.30